MALPRQPIEERDPWWTLMVFFNSLRELGTSLSLLQSDIPDYLGVIRNRLGLDWTAVRGLRRVRELTGRLSDDQIPRSIDDLSQPAGSGATDVCLASNIIEVGIDIDRLSLMTVVGQPKTTATYIQVTGRVGRLWQERPGLIVTIYSPSKPRDRSHFEKFRSYHERLYAQVEPTSVTPFAPPVLDRALHAVMIGFVRQNGESHLDPYPVPEAAIREAFELLEKRVLAVDENERSHFEEMFNKRRREWETFERTRWRGQGGDEDFGLLRRPGEYVPRLVQKRSWATPTSLRNVDAECKAEVSPHYIEEEMDV
jgi:superfamily II DNA/RNA helicase